jgi:CBS domain-containing protein
MEGEFISIPEDVSIEEAYKLMRLHLKEEFSVVDKTGKLVGRVGIFDVIRAVFRQKGIVK